MAIVTAKGSWPDLKAWFSYNHLRYPNHAPHPQLLSVAFFLTTRYWFLYGCLDRMEIESAIISNFFSVL